MIRRVVPILIGESATLELRFWKRYSDSWNKSFKDVLRLDQSWRGSVPHWLEESGSDGRRSDSCREPPLPPLERKWQEPCKSVAHKVTKDSVNLLTGKDAPKKIPRCPADERIGHLAGEWPLGPSIEVESIYHDTLYNQDFQSFPCLI